jgi:DNA-binding MarR family transcriptional regulator
LWSCGLGGFKQVCQLTDAIDQDRSDFRQDANRTVRVSDRDVAEAKRLLSLLAEVDIAGGPSSSARRSGSGGLLDAARAILAARRRREALFGTTIFGEPAWDMLLILYLGASESRRTLGRLGELAGISKSTALRWIDYLERHRLVRREPHPTDKRAAFVELTEKARKAMDMYLSGTSVLTE